jgi:hypothetical protein
MRRCSSNRCRVTLQAFAVMVRGMGASAAQRQRRRRERERLGLIVLPIEVDETAITEQLVLAGFLAPSEIDNRSAITSALERVVHLWAQGAAQ